MSSQPAEGILLGTAFNLVRQFSVLIGIRTFGIVEEARGDNLDAIYAH